MRIRWVSTALAVALTVAVGGCGADAEEDARAVLDEYLTAAAASDIVGVCELWSPWVARDQLILFGVADQQADDIPEECENIAPPLSPFVARVDEDPSVEQTECADGAHSFKVEGVEGEMEIREFDGEWRFNSVCMQTFCTPATEEPFEAPIGG